MTDNPAHMWKHWRDKYGYETALKDYYPELSEDPYIKLNLLHINHSKTAIDNYLHNLEEEESEE